MPVPFHCCAPLARGLPHPARYETIPTPLPHRVARVGQSGQSPRHGLHLQGRLNAAANPTNGSHDLTFSLWNAATGPAQVGVTLTNAATAVGNGLFTVVLDFGNQFPGAGVPAMAPN